MTVRVSKQTFPRNFRYDLQNLHARTHAQIQKFMIIRFHKITYSYLYTINTKSEIFDHIGTIIN